MIQSVISRVGYPALLFGSLAASVVLGRFETPAVLQVSAVVGTVALLIVLWEWLAPMRATWRPTGRRLGLDLAHTVLSSGLPSRIAEAGLLALAAGAAGGLARQGVWPSEQPLVLQMTMALLIGELGAYSFHRTCHETRLFWRIHVVHHSAEALHVWASGRAHPFNAALVYGAQSAALVLLGAPAEVLSLMAVFTGVNGMLQHANIDARDGILRWVISTNHHHRWHHSTVVEEANSNYGNNLIVWDRVFGTCLEPEGAPEHTGLEGTDIPESLPAHWGAPFVLSRYESFDVVSDPPDKI